MSHRGYGSSSGQYCKKVLLKNPLNPASLPLKLSPTRRVSVRPKSKNTAQTAKANAQEAKDRSGAPSAILRDAFFRFSHGVTQLGYLLLFAERLTVNTYDEKVVRCLEMERIRGLWRDILWNLDSCARRVCKCVQLSRFVQRTLLLYFYML